MAWIGFTLLAAFSQAIRNLLQSKLTAQFDATAVTLSRFTYAAPLAIAYLLLLQNSYSIGIQPLLPSAISHLGLLYCGLAAVAQITGTACLVQMFKHKNYLVGAGLAKTEALLTGLLGMLLFSAALSVLGWLGVLLGTFAVLLLSGINKSGRASLKVILLGLSCGTLFALTALFTKQAASHIDLMFPVDAALVLAYVLSLQTLIMLGWASLVTPSSLKVLIQAPVRVVLISIAGFIASLGWFSAVALQEAAYVRTLGQVEILISIVLSVVLLRHAPSKSEILGLVLILISAVLVLLG